MKYQEFLDYCKNHPNVKLYDIYNDAFQLWREAVESNTRDLPGFYTTEQLLQEIDKAIELLGEDVVEDFKQFYIDNEDTL